MTSQDHLHDFLRWRAVIRLEAGWSQLELTRWLQVVRKWSPGCGINFKQVIISPGRSDIKPSTSQDRYLALSAKHLRWTRDPQFTLDLAAVSGRRVSWQTIYRRLTETDCPVRWASRLGCVFGCIQQERPGIVELKTSVMDIIRMVACSFQ
ncbi:hypothetical protein TNCV_3576071 [Trichonephila clavipes]|nr:hypothetical protein TNCV_3576071 [Trichonephila clavipes]